MCARIGMVTGRGLAGALHRKFPRPFILIAAIALFSANSINVGADLSDMADAAKMLTQINSQLFVVVFGIGISLATIWFRYHQIATILKWLALVLLAYVITGFIIKPDWSKIAHAAFIPKWPKNHSEWATLVAILGTTISPYLFFWQASQEVEEEKSKGRRMLTRRFGVSPREIITRKIDIDIGTFFRIWSCFSSS
jgi:Mn2+/Fe2+ NRAMP family transporter